LTITIKERIMNIEEIAIEIGKMDRDSLSELADYLVWNHEGRAENLSTFIGFSQMDKVEADAQYDYFAD